MNRDSKLIISGMGKEQLADLDAQLEGLVRAHGARAFSETALSGLAKGTSAVLIERQTQLNEAARAAEATIKEEE